MCKFLVESVCFCFKQKTAYEMRISDWSSDVCSSDLPLVAFDRVEIIGVDLGTLLQLVRATVSRLAEQNLAQTIIDVILEDALLVGQEIGRASCRERVCQYV